MPLLELFDETLDINSTENYELSVQISFGEISFCILDTLRNKFVLLRSYSPEENCNFTTTEINECMTKDDFLTRHYKKINLITPSSKVTLVPGFLYEDSKKEEYFRYNLNLSEGEIIKTNDLRMPNLVIIFSIPSEIQNAARQFFPGCQSLHQIFSLLNYLNLTQRASTSNAIHLNIEKDYFNLIVLDQNKLRLCNTFRYKVLSDIQYYVLYILKLLNISTSESVNISGNGVAREAIIKTFSPYISSRFPVPSSKHTFSYVFTETELNKYLSLFTAAICE